MQQANWPNLFRILGSADTKTLHFTLKNSILVALDRALSVKRSEHELYKENQMLKKKLIDAELRIENEKTSFEIKQMATTAAIQDYQRKLRVNDSKATSAVLRATTLAQAKYPIMKDIGRKLEQLKSQVETTDGPKADDNKKKDVKSSTAAQIDLLQTNLALKNSELVKLRNRLDNVEFNPIGTVQEFEDRLAAKDACIQWQQLRHNVEKTTVEDSLRAKNTEIWRIKEDKNDACSKYDTLVKQSDELLQKVHELEQSIRDKENKEMNLNKVDVNDNVYKNANLYL